MRLCGSRKRSLVLEIASGHYRRLPGASTFPSRPRDRPSRAAGARRARGGAALRPRRHRDRRSSRPAADRGARPRRDRPRRRVHDLQLPHLRDDGGRRARVGSRAGTTRPRGSPRRRSGPRSGSGSCCSSPARSSRSPLLRGLGGHGRSGDYALTYFRIAAVGLPAALVALAGQGYLRGVSNLRRPLGDRRRRKPAQPRPRGRLRLRLPLGHRRLGGGNGDRAGRDGRGIRRRAAASARAVAAPEPAGDAAALPRSGGRSSCARPRSMPRSSSPHRCSRGWATRSSGAHQIAYQLFLFLALDPRRDRDRRPGDRRPDARRRRRGRRVRGRAADDRLVGRGRARLRGRARAALGRAAAGVHRAIRASSTRRRSSGRSSP